MEQFIIIVLEIYGALQIENDIEFKVFKFDNSTCKNCALRERCIYKDKNGKPQGGGRRLKVPIRYYAVLKDKKRVETKEF
jgi:hypothetical protein